MREGKARGKRQQAKGNMKISSYKDLIVWQKSMQLVKQIFLLTSKFPKSEQYGLVSQMTRAAIAIPSNIAEGYGRQSRNSYKQFLLVAYGSALELETQILIAKDLNFATQKDCLIVESLLTEVTKMLNVLISRIRENTNEH